MALTAKPMTTISYNSEGFLKRKLQQMFETGKLEDYRYIFHYGEGGDKDHFHVMLFPNRRIDSVELREEFKEITTDEKPLGCMPFRKNSLFDHWIMYVIHDPDYLKAHQSQDDGDGKIEYPLEDIKTPFPEQLQRDYKVAIRLKKTDNQKIIEDYQKGKTPIDVAYENNINPSHIMAITNLFRLSMQTSNEGLVNIMKDTIQDLQSRLEASEHNNQVLMLRDLEEKTGEDLHTKPKEKWFDADEE